MHNTRHRASETDTRGYSHIQKDVIWLNNQDPLPLWDGPEGIHIPRFRKREPSSSEEEGGGQVFFYFFLNGQWLSGAETTTSPPRARPKTNSMRHVNELHFVRLYAREEKKESTSGVPFCVSAAERQCTKVAGESSFFPPPNKLVHKLCSPAGVSISKISRKGGKG